MELNREELALYDRQIRLYGASAQIKIRKSHVMLVCGWNQLTQEVCKNLILNGVGTVSIKLQHAAEITSETEPLTMFGKIEEAKKYLQDLNSRVTLKFYDFDDSTYLVEKIDHVVYIMEQTEWVLNHYSSMKSAGITFSWIMIHMNCFYLINDFQTHSYKASRNKGSNNTQITSVLEFPAMNAYAPLLNEHVRDQKNRMNCVSLAAIGGAIASQEAIKAVTSENMPIIGLLNINGHTLTSQIVQCNNSP